MKELRSLVRREHGRGWTLDPQSGKVKLTRRLPDGGRSSVVLDLPWSSSSSTAVLTRLQAIHQMEDVGLSLADAVEQLTAGDQASSPAEGATNWPVLVEAFRKHKNEDSGEIKLSTWESMYLPVMNQLLEVMDQRPAPRDGPAVLATLRDAYGGAPGTQGRRQRILYAAQFLRYAVDKRGVPKRWLPPPSLSDYIGKRLTPKRDSTPLKSPDIVRLLEGIADPRWRLAVELLVCFGLRPVELKHCSPGADGASLRVSYRKRTSRGSTKPRLALGLDPVGLPGLTARAVAKLASGEPGLPPLGATDGETSKALRVYLDRRPIWQELKQEAAARGEKLTPYSLRHGYALRAHQDGGLTVRASADSMGHSALTHNSAYGTWSDVEVQEAAFTQARERIEQLQPEASPPAPERLARRR
ncbi:hypothetical protein [Cyanobium sp. ATX 6F1]|uniref:hypothetical protein n=1 Tax=Cyanobium sp. ATX 6F1 TaxID=2823702 RepID=UPI0020CED3F6|nr:hypothetical protein [Cyanobium sp. ATX 6F1]MCP9917607.1 hypothetical protein [Cyanobium sp. ATX 6F1]